MPLVSVVVPVYNHEKYIKEAIESVLAQTFKDFELIIINNGSTDSSGKIIESFEDPRIKLFNFPHNKGGVYAANFGVSQATGKYIAYFCSDDVFELTKLEKQVSCLETNPDLGAVFSQVDVINEVGDKFNNENHFYFGIFEQENRSRHEWLNRFFHLGNCLCFPSALIRKAVLEDVGQINPCFTQLCDLDLWIRVCLKYNILILPEKLVKYRVRDNELNTSGNTLDNTIRNTWEHTHIIKSFFSIDSIDELFKIFPELKIAHPPGFFVDQLIPFYVALLCFEKEIIAMHACALEQIYYLLQTAEPLLNEKCQFSYNDFYKLISKCDLYRVTALNELTVLKQELITFKQRVATLEQVNNTLEQEKITLNQALHIAKQQTFVNIVKRSLRKAIKIVKYLLTGKQ